MTTVHWNVGLLVVALAGCSKLLGIEDLEGAPDGGGSIDGSPDAPRAMSPPNGAYTGSAYAMAALRPTFRWDAVAGATRYELAYDRTCTSANDCAFTGATTAEVSATSFQPDALAVETQATPLGSRYYWRLRACNDKACSQWSATRYLNVGRQRYDFNGDGYQDLAVGSFGGDRTLIYHGSETGIAAGTPPAPTTTISSNLYLYTGNSQASGDFNGDGFADLALGAFSSDQMHRYVLVLLGGANGLVGAAIAKRLESPDSADVFASTLVAPGDIDGDGFDDLVVPASPHAYLYRGGATVFAGEPAPLAPPAGLVVHSPSPATASGDLDGDGYADVVFGMGPAMIGAVTTIVPYRGGAGGLALGTPITDPASEQFGFSFAAADLDSDGHPELLTGRLRGSAVELVVYPGSARGLAAQPDGAPITDPDGVTVGGLMAFTRADGTALFTITNTRVVTVWDSHRNRIRRIDGADRFGSEVGLCDCSGDGFPEILVADRDLGSGTVYLFKHTSGGIDNTPLRTITQVSGQANDQFGYSLPR